MPAGVVVGVVPGALVAGALVVAAGAEGVVAAGVVAPGALDEPVAATRHEASPVGLA